MAKKGFMSKCGKWTPIVVFFGAFAAVFAAIVVPYAFIWALNELFGLHIVFTFYTWLAAVILIVLVMPKGRFMPKGK